MRKIGKRLIELREQKSLNQRELGEAVDIHPANISFLELNKRGVTMDQALKLSNFFGISIDELLADPVQEPA